ncbi:Reticulocalbin 2, EF-hand calcium binding domain, partial [Cichlidogyrus casuarinus]
MTEDIFEDDDDVHRSLHPDMDDDDQSMLDHDLIAGSHEEAEAMKLLSPDEAKRRLILLVKKMDINKDGKIDKEEMRTWILTSFKNLDLEEANSTLHRNDENSDGLISFNEYTHKNYGYRDGEIDEMRKETNEDTRAFIRGIDEDKQKFEMADLNKDGLLNALEYTAFLHPGHYPH